MLFLFVLCHVLFSCTKEKTNYNKELEPGDISNQEVKVAYKLNIGDYEVSIKTRSGKLHLGYNKIYIELTNRFTGERAPLDAFQFSAVMNHSSGQKAAAPYRFDLGEQVEEGPYAGYVVFPDQSSADVAWTLYMQISIYDQTYALEQEVQVEAQENKNLNMTTFIGEDDDVYCVALIAPQQPIVGENELITGIYRYTSFSNISTEYNPGEVEYAFLEAKGYTLKLDPRMPDPSMGNHSSPNNKDLAQRDDGLYYGQVNYTMTGNWTLNFILLNGQGQVVKGEDVPTDFTPGVEGVKSTLHLDILF